MEEEINDLPGLPINTESGILDLGRQEVRDISGEEAVLTGIRMIPAFPVDNLEGVYMDVIQGI